MTTPPAGASERPLPSELPERTGRFRPATGH